MPSGEPVKDSFVPHGAPLRPLTSLRFVAALMVFFDHTALTEQLSQTFAIAWSGVAFFFMLSGFVLTYAYYERFERGVTWESLRSFYIARFARIYPIYLLTLCITLAVAIAMGEVVWHVLPLTLVAQTVMLQSWIPDIRVYQGLNAPEWSLSVEAFFYALFPFLIVALNRLFRTASAYVVIATGGALWGIWGLTIHGMHGLWINWALYVFPPARLIDFISGVLVAIALRKSKPRPFLYPTALEALTIVGVVAGLGLMTSVPMSLRYSFVITPCFAALIYVFALQHGEISQLLSSRLATRLGEISFAMYLIQWPILKLSNLLGIWRQPWGFGSALVVTLAASFCLFHFVEVPMREYVRDAFERRRLAVAVS